MQIRFYAGAADVAGTDILELDLGEVSAADLVSRLGADNPSLAEVLGLCSLLVDGRTVSDLAARIPVAARVDVLPPFAGG